MSIEHADFEGVERLSLVTGGDIVSTFDSPDKVKLGHCKLYVHLFCDIFNRTFLELKK